MSELERLLGGAGDDVEVALLRAGKTEAPTDGSAQRTLLALGLGTGIAGAASSATAATAAATALTAAASGPAAGASVPPGAVATTVAAQSGISVLVKWIGIAGVAGLVTWGAVHQLTAADPSLAQAPAEAPVPAAADPMEGEPIAAEPNAAEPATIQAPVAAAQSPDTAPAEPVPTEPKPVVSTPSVVQRQPAAPAAKTPAKTLGDEVAALDKASQAIDDDPDAALAALEAYDKGFKGGVLSQEADVLKIEALAAAGRQDEAKAAASAFFAKHPNSPLAGRVQRAIQ